MAVKAKRPAKQVAKQAAKQVAKKVAKKSAAPKQRKAYKAVLKTNRTDASVAQFLADLPDPAQRADAQVLEALFAKATKQPPKMWGDAIVGYGDYSYVGASGRSGDWFLTGFSPRKGTLTLYALGGFAHQQPLLDALGSYRLGGGCLYLKRLAGVDMHALNALVTSALERAKALAPTMMNQRPR